MKVRVLLALLLFSCSVPGIVAQCPNPTILTGGSSCSGVNKLSICGSSTASQILWKRNGATVATVNRTWSTTGVTVAGGNGMGSGAKQFNKPETVTMDAAGNLYVADRENYRVQKFPPGSRSATAGVTVATLTSTPWDIFVNDSNYIFVLTGFELFRFPPGSNESTAPVTIIRGNYGVTLYSARGLYIDTAGNFYISDSHHRVQKFPPNVSSSTTTGTVIAGGNGMGNAANQLSFPEGISVDLSGNLYVCEWGNDRVQRFPPGSTSATNGITIAGAGYGSNANQTRHPHHLFRDNAGYLYVSDLENYRVQRFPPGSVSGTNAVTVAGGNGYGAGANQLQNAEGIFVNENGTLYIADLDNHRVQAWGYSIDTTYLPTAPGNYTATLTFPNGSTVFTNSVVVNPAVSPAVSIALTNTALCSGDTAIFASTHTDGGTAPLIYWFVNNVFKAQGDTLAGVFSNLDRVVAVLQSNALCAIPARDTSDELTVNLTPAVTPTITVSANLGDTICTGAQVTFWSLFSHGGTNPLFQWKKNGVGVGSNSTYSTGSINDQDNVWCELVSDAACASQQTATSNVLKMTVNSCTGIELAQEGGVKIYPNPVQSMLSVEVAVPLEDLTTEIFTADGRLVKNESSCAQKNLINISSLPPGIYLLRLKNASGEIFFRQQLIKMPG